MGWHGVYLTEEGKEGRGSSGLQRGWYVMRPALITHLTESSALGEFYLGGFSFRSSTPWCKLDWEGTYRQGNRPEKREVEGHPEQMCGGRNTQGMLGKDWPGLAGVEPNSENVAANKCSLGVRSRG